MEGELRRSIERLESIGSPSASLDRILTLAADCESDLGELTSAIESDPAVTSRVLRLSNSAYFGVARQVETLDHAILVIGYRNVMSLATCAALAPMFAGDDPCVDRGALWRHSCATAEAARLLCRGGPVDPSTGYIAGLIHDLGIAVLSEVLGDDYGPAVERARQREETLAEAERELFGVDHAWAAGVLFERWTLPERLVNAVTRHHAPDEDPTGFAAAVALADQMARAAGYLGPSGHRPGEPSLTLLDLAGYKPADFDAATAEFEERREAIELSAGGAV